MIPTYAQAENFTPTIGALTIATSSQGADISSLVLTEATTTNVYIRGTASDENGCEDIDSNADYTAVFYRSEATNQEACSADPLDCYQVDENDPALAGSCVLDVGDKDVAFEFVAPIQFYANPTDVGPFETQVWYGYVKVEDENAATANAANNDSFEIVSSTSLSVDQNIIYGDLSVDQTSNTQAVTVSNTGNTSIDYTIAANGNMNCTIGSMPPENVQYSLISDFLFGSGTPVTGSSTLVDASIPSQTGGTAPVQSSLYMILRAPATGVGGTCGNTLTFTAVAN